jgi:FixJ family two-component response regulator
VLFKGELETHHVQLTCVLPPGCIVCAVRTQMQQLILNLVSNASQSLRERQDGERRLTLRLARIACDRAEIRVSDSGVGVAAEHRDRLFDPFFTTRSDGLGMGLAICRSIVEAHGGEICAQSNDDGGATFRVTLPVVRFERRPRRGGPARADAAVARGNGHGGAIVCVVDDDIATRDGVCRLLLAEGCSSVAFASAADALASPELASAQCIILDVQMPGMSGPELQAELARRGIATPIVFLSARSDAFTGVEAMKRGAFEYLAKPVDEDVLVAAVRRAIERHAHLAHAAAERRAYEGRLARLTPRELDVLRRVIAGRLNKQIASDLAISEATVKQHRGQVMDKMQVRSVADLVRACELAGMASA